MGYRQPGVMVLLFLMMLLLPALLMGRSAAVWDPLFNGKDLTGWSTTGNWRATADGVLAIEPRSGETGWQRYADYLWTEKKYANYMLRLQYKISPGGNSGIFLGVKNKKILSMRGLKYRFWIRTGKKKLLHPTTVAA